MKLDDDRWDGLCGGYRVPYDPRPALKAAEFGNANGAWDELCQKLHHQGDVGIASYAAVPEIVRLIARAPSANWTAYSLLATIEECRLGVITPNPPLPIWLAEDYQAAWRAILQPALRHFADADDDLSVCCILAVLAHAKGQTSLGVFAVCTADEREAMLKWLIE